jgi:long-chain acyl-CoA synthetase
MSNEATTPHGVMEGGGTYNRRARVQALGGNLALPFLEQAVENIALDSGTQPVVIADYGSSQGKNSLAPMRTAIKALRARLGPDRPITVTHVDQAANDFNTLFEVLHKDSERYASDDRNVFPSAIGRSFYEQVFPPECVHLGWSSYAAMWLSRIPTYATGHFRPDYGTDAERARFREQARKDWGSFLSLRARELRPGGRLVVVLAARNDEGNSGLEELMDQANAVLADMVSEGAIRAEERARMVLGSCVRRRSELLAPFNDNGQFQGLTVENCELTRLADPIWVAYERDGNKEAMATERAGLFRATFAPSLAGGLADARASNAFADRLEDALKQRLANCLAPWHTFVQTMVLAKQDCKSAAIRQRAAADGVSRKSGTPTTLGELLHSRAFENPDAPAVFCNDREMSYGELDHSTLRLARWLLDSGLNPGDRVAIHWCNSIEAVQLFFAIFKAGLIAVPINLRLKPPEVAWILQHSKSLMCFSEPALAPIAEQARPGCPSLRCILTQLPAFTEGEAGTLPNVEEHQHAAIFYTSGSTARPKGAVHTHRTLREAAHIIAREMMNRDDTVLMMTQMMHVVGFGCDLLPAISLGLPTALVPAFDPGAVLDTIERFRCAFTIGLPALLQLIIQEQTRKPRNTSSLRTVLAAGDTVPLNLQEQFAAVFGMPLQEAMGMTETYPIAFNPKLGIRPGSLGVSMGDVEVAIVDARNKELADCETGELTVRSPANCVAYWNDPAATQELLHDGWLHTGDLAARDSDGYLWFKGRKKEIIVHGGSNVSPQEVEEVLYQHPNIFEAGVVGAPDPIYGERVIAFVSVRNGRTPGEQDLREYARRSLADYKVPERIFFIPELPKGTTGKVHRSALKAMLVGRIDDQ